MVLILLFISLLWKWQTSFTLSLFNSHGVDVTIHCSWGGFFKTICSQCRFSVWTDFNSWLKTIITCCSGVNVSLTGWHTSAAAQSLCALLSFIHTNITSDICYTIGWNKMRRECCTIRLPRPFPIRPTNMKGALLFCLWICSGDRKQQRLHVCCGRYVTPAGCLKARADRRHTAAVWFFFMAGLQLSWRHSTL